ncbi:MAG: hypothetical protein BGO01_03750 [Armatimonadetes bacterium 55-13]|nr:hypothetical protein [Armatimonadota bacterium]OJU63061.1 MAG: hypothetical protein BGO01_03750 [Armatimonadetes bacterium 55-13]
MHEQDEFAQNAVARIFELRLTLNYLRELHVECSRLLNIVPDNMKLAACIKYARASVERDASVFARELKGFGVDGFDIGEAIEMPFELWQDATSTNTTDDILAEYDTDEDDDDADQGQDGAA